MAQRVPVANGSGPSSQKDLVDNNNVLRNNQEMPVISSKKIATRDTNKKTDSAF